MEIEHSYSQNMIYLVIYLVQPHHHHHQSELVGDVAVPVSARQAVLF